MKDLSSNPAKPKAGRCFVYQRHVIFGYIFSILIQFFISIKIKRICLLIGMILAIVGAGIYIYIKAREDIPSVSQGSNGDIEGCLGKTFSAQEVSVEPWDLGEASPYIISLKSRQFEPSENKDEALKCFAFLPKDKKYYAFLQLYDAPSDQDKAVLTQYGIELLNYIPKNSWFVSFSQSLEDEDMVNVGKIVRWVGMILPQDKVSIDLWEGKFGSWAVEGDEVLITISFFENVLSEEAESVIQKYEGEILGKLGASNDYTVKVHKDFIREIAEENVVRYMDRIPPPATTFGDIE